MKQILFPEDEIKNIKQDIANNGGVWTIRVSKEYRKYSEGEILGSIFGNLVVKKIIRIGKGIDELKEKYLYFNELTDEMLKNIKFYKKMDVIQLRKV